MINLMCQGLCIETVYSVPHDDRYFAAHLVAGGLTTPIWIVNRKCLNVCTLERGMQMLTLVIPLQKKFNRFNKAISSP